jgi:hypothetical protein
VTIAAGIGVYEDYSSKASGFVHAEISPIQGDLMPVDAVKARKTRGSPATSERAQTSSAFAVLAA